MLPDIEGLDAPSLDARIAAAAARRAKLEPAVTNEPPAEWNAAVNPRWYLHPAPMGTVFRVRHPGVGWVEFVVPTAERATMIGLLVAQALTPAVPQQPIMLGNRATRRRGKGG